MASSVPNGGSSPGASRGQGPSEQALLGRSQNLAANLPALLLAAERVAATVQQGLHGRRRVGQGDSFWQFRRYHPGDAAQRIDWRQSAKTEALFVRETEWEAAASVWLWRDASASMRFASSPRVEQKMERADLLLLALASLLIDGGERVALLGDGRRPATGRAVLRRLAHQIDEQRAGDAKRFANLPAEIPLPPYANVVWLSDFLDPPETIEACVRFYASLGVHGHLVQVLDQAEETLPYDGHVRFDGMEGEGEERIRRVETIRAGYHRRLQAQREALARITQSVGWTLHHHRTDKPPQTALLALYTALAESAGMGR